MSTNIDWSDNDPKVIESKIRIANLLYWFFNLSHIPLEDFKRWR